MGKYDSLKGKLPAFVPETTPDYQERLKRRLAEEGGKPVEQLVARYVKIRQQKDAIEKELSDVDLTIAALIELIQVQYEALGVDSLRLSTGDAAGASLGSHGEPYAQIKDKHKLFDWIKRNGLSEMFTVNWSSLNAMVKERLLAGKPLPPGVDAFLQTKFTLRGAPKNVVVQ